MAEMQEHQCMEEDNSMTSGGAKKRTSITKFFRKPFRNRSTSNNRPFGLSRRRSSDSDSDDSVKYGGGFSFSCKPGVLNNVKNARKKYIMNVKMRYTDSEHFRAVFFAKLRMTNGQFDEESREVELIRSGRQNLEMMDSIGGEHYSAAYMEALFDPGEDGIIPRVVVLQGPAGIGKTWTVRKIMWDWANRNLYRKKFKYVFHLSCKELRQIRSGISMVTVLTQLSMLVSREHFAEILAESEKILFLIDDFDEMPFIPMFKEGEDQDLFRETRIQILLDRLYKRLILPNCSLLITTRLKELNELRQGFTSPRCVEILGFTGEDRLEYFYNGYTDEETKTAVNFIKENKLMFTLCAVPFTCHVLKTEILKYPQLIQTITTTDLYIRYMRGLLHTHRKCCCLSSITWVEMSQLANDGVWSQKFLFKEEDKYFGCLLFTELGSLFLNEIIIQRNNETRTCYSFIHWSVQAFFAALYYVLNEKFEISRELEETLTLLKRSQVNPQLTLMLRFLFGLYSDVNLNEVAKCVRRGIPTRHKSILEDWLMRESFNHHNEVLQCLYEAQDEDFVGRVMGHMSQILIQGSGPGENQEPLLDIAVSYCLQKSPINHMVTFSNYTLSLETQSRLFPGLRKCSKLEFFSCRVLDISRLCQSIRDVQELRLECCGLTSSCCEALRSVITTNPSLIKLDLSHNNLQDSGVKDLCDGLQDPGCVLQKLRLRQCGLTSSCCEALRSVITTNRSLITLDLSHNNLQDSGAQYLCEGLQDPGCVLQELRLERCDLTSSCCEDLRSVITTNPSLIKLDLSHNNLQDSEVKRLCEGLRDPLALT
uniref:NACHT domain-containing protein n=1 Tax=Leptobrachium leishanense TaxID=445787 RepID=A0A8C5PTQ2_9ANUR